MKILGLSHIVFTVNSTKVNKDDYLTHSFEDSQNYSFDHSVARSKMIRDERNNISMLDFFKYKDNYGPSIELLYSFTKENRPSQSYGIIDKTFIPNNFDFNTLDHDFLGKTKSYFSSSLNCEIITSTESIDTDYGCWIEVSNFANHVEMLKSFFGMELTYFNGQIAKFKSIIINTSLSPFTLIVIKSKAPKIYYKDDRGLSSLGWFAKSLPEKSFDSFSLSDQFNLSLFTKKLKGRFIFDNNGIAHEILKL